MASFLSVEMQPSMWNPIARTDSVGNLGFAKRSLEYFLKILAPERCHTRMPFYIGNDGSFLGTAS